MRLRRNADAGVKNLAADRYLPAGLGNGIEPHRDFTLLGELDRVANKVGHDLAQPSRVADDTRPYVLEHKAGQIQPLTLGLLRQEIHGALDYLAEVKRGLLNLQLACLYFREVEDVVDDPQQRVSTLPDGGEEFALLFVQRRIQQQTGHTHDGIHRGANLMTGVGEELRLDPR